MKYQKPQPKTKVKLHKKGANIAELAPSTPREATFNDAPPALAAPISPMISIPAQSVNTGVVTPTVQPLAQAMTFGQAFAAVRKAGLQVFDWNGKKYGTQLASQPKAPIVAHSPNPQGPPDLITHTPVPSPFVQGPPTFINGPEAWRNTPGSAPIPTPAPPAQKKALNPEQQRQQKLIEEGKAIAEARDKRIQEANKNFEYHKKAQEIMKNRELNAKAAQKEKETERGINTRKAMTNGIPTTKNPAASYWERQQAAAEMAYRMTHRNW